MFIISNNCIAGYIYRDIVKSKYPHPFIWSAIYGNNFITFLQDLENINYFNFELKKKQESLKIPNGWYIRIDDKINVDYIHMWFSPIDSIPRIHNNEVFYNKIWEYIINKYTTRLKRMKIENPIVFIEDKRNEVDVLKAIEICKAKHYKCFAFTNKLPECTSDTLVIRPHNLKSDEPNDYVKKYSKEILEFINHS